jgi:hypothetical protein
MAFIDQDGPVPDDTVRARQRGLWKGRQGTDGVVPIKGNLDPQTWATLEAIFAKWAAPGMCNPADQAPCMPGTPSQAQLDADTRSLGQRNHDALKAMARAHAGQGGHHGPDRSAAMVAPAHLAPGGQPALDARAADLCHCTVPCYGTQVHPIISWTKDGQTDRMLKDPDPEDDEDDA